MLDSIGVKRIATTEKIRPTRRDAQKKRERAAEKSSRDAADNDDKEKRLGNSIDERC